MDPVQQVHTGLERFAFSGYGVVYSYTVLQDAPTDFAPQAPYILAVIQLDEGPMITAQLTDVDEPVSIGDRVEMVTRRLTNEGHRGMIVYGYKFRKVIVQSE